jgi:hypothetical protein
MLFDAAHLCQGDLQFTVHSGTGVGETQGFRFHAIHQNDADTRKHVIIQFAQGSLHKLLPCEALLGTWHPFLFK